MAKSRFRTILLAGTLMALLVGKGVQAEETKFGKKTKPFSLETTISVDSDIKQGLINTNLNIAGEYNFNTGDKILGDLTLENGLPQKTVLAVGNKNFYLGTKWENLSSETSMLEDANLFKLELGIKNIADFLDFSSFVAYTSIPNLRILWTNYSKYESYYEAPLNLYTLGIDGIAKPIFELKNSAITPWLSWKILLNDSRIRNTEKPNSTYYNDSSSLWAFNHFNVGLGIDLSTKKNLNFGLENYLDGSYDPLFQTSPLFGTVHKAKIKLHDKKNKNSLGYTFSINPQFNWLGWPVVFDSQSEIDFKFHFSPEIYLKATLNINHSVPENSNLIAILGYSEKTGNKFELFYNILSKMIGITIFNKELRNDKERYSKEIFAKIAPSPTEIYLPIQDKVNLTAIHNIYGEDISGVIDYVKSRVSGNYNSAMKEISEYAYYFPWRNHAGVFTAEEEHDVGYGACMDTNGMLLPVIINGVLGDLGYRSWGRGFSGPYLGHVLTIIKKPNNRYDIMNYNNFYSLNAKTEQEAIDRVYPGIYIYDGGKYSETSERVIDTLEESVWR